MIITNAFSLNMIDSFPARMEVEEISNADAKEIAQKGVESAVGHADTAAVFSAELGVEIPAERRTVALTSGDTVLVGQYRGPRLEEGCTKLPEGATIKWLLVYVSYR